VIIKGYISEFDGKNLTVIAPFSDPYLLDRKNITECEIRLDDGRRISADQRRKIFALIRDITDWVSAPGSAQRTRAEIETLRQMQLLYLIDYADTEAVRYQLTQHYCQLTNQDLFSLSDVDMSTARDFIDWLVEQCVIHGIPCIDTLLNRCEDIGRYLYACVANRRCAVCGAKADIHEVEKVGAGRNRREIHHLGQLVQPLCRKHHNEVESTGQQSFDRKYCMNAIRLDENLCEIIKWKK
jgi:hypothetical protein